MAASNEMFERLYRNLAVRKTIKVDPNKLQKLLKRTKSTSRTSEHTSCQSDLSVKDTKRSQFKEPKCDVEFKEFENSFDLSAVETSFDNILTSTKCEENCEIKDANESVKNLEGSKGFEIVIVEDTSGISTDGGTITPEETERSFSSLEDPSFSPPSKILEDNRQTSTFSVQAIPKSLSNLDNLSDYDRCFNKITESVHRQVVIQSTDTRQHVLQHDISKPQSNLKEVSTKKKKRRTRQKFMQATWQKKSLKANGKEQVKRPSSANHDQDSQRQRQLLISDHTKQHTGKTLSSTSNEKRKLSFNVALASNSKTEYEEKLKHFKERRDIWQYTPDYLMCKRSRCTTNVSQEGQLHGSVVNKIAKKLQSTRRKSASKKLNRYHVEDHGSLAMLPRNLRRVVQLSVSRTKELTSTRKKTDQSFTARLKDHSAEAVRRKKKNSDTDHENKVVKKKGSTFDRENAGNGRKDTLGFKRKGSYQSHHQGKTMSCKRPIKRKTSDTTEVNSTMANEFKKSKVNDDDKRVEVKTIFGGIFDEKKTSTAKLPLVKLNQCQPTEPQRIQKLYPLSSLLSWSGNRGIQGHCGGTWKSIVDEC